MKKCFLGIFLFFLFHAGSSFICTFWGSAPTLGDDALVYDWRAHFFKNGYRVEAPILKSIQSIAKQRTPDNPKADWFRYRGFVRIFGSYTPLSDTLFSVATNLKLNIKAEFFCMEIMVLVLMIFALSLGLRTMIGSSAAGISLLVLAGIWLPNQGLHYHIPSVLTTSLSFWLFSYVLSKKSKINIWLFVPVVMLLPGFHTIGRVYLFLIGALILLRKGSLSRREVPKSLGTLAVLGGSILFWSMGKYIFPNIFPFSSEDFGGLSDQMGFKANCVAALHIWKQFVKANPFVLAVLVLLAPMSFEKKVKTNVSLFLLPASLLLLTLFYLPVGNYPAELFSRLLVFFVILVSAAVGERAKLCFAEKDKWKHLVLLLLSFHVVSGFVRWTKYAFTNLNGRQEFIDIEALRSELGLLPANSTVVFSEGDLSLMSSLIAGLREPSALDYQMIMQTPQEDQLKGAANLWGISPTFRNLTTSSMVESRQLHQRRLGFFSQEINRILVETGGAQNGPVFVFVESLERKPVSLQFSAGTREETIEVGPNFRGWIQTPIGSGAEGLVVTLGHGKLWVLGIRSEVSERIFWPWNEGWTVTAMIASEDKSLKKVTFIFKLEELLKTFQVETLVQYLRPKGKVQSDKSGFVIWQF